MTNIEDQLRRAALRSGRSVKSLADEARIPYAGLHGFLTGRKSITMTTAARLARALGLTLVRRAKRKGR